jgi:threonine/homoserine/homoserine lactone efflux protein
VLTFLVLGAGIGLAAGLSPGPVLTTVVLETFRGGWARGAAVAAGPVLSLAGGAFFLYLAATALLESRRPRPVVLAHGGVGAVAEDEGGGHDGVLLDGHERSRSVTHGSAIGSCGSRSSWLMTVLTETETRAAPRRCAR